MSSSRIRITILLDVGDCWGLPELLKSLRGSSESELGKAIIEIIFKDLEILDDLDWSVEISDPEIEEKKNGRSKSKDN